VGSAWRGNGGDDFRAGAPNVFKRFQQEILIARVERDIFACGTYGLETDGLADDKGDGFGLSFPHALGSVSAAFAEMQRMVAELVGQDREFCTGIEIRQELDLPTRAPALSGANLFRIR
jgi:hypothetical protein